MRDKLLKLTLKIIVYLFAFVSFALAESFEFEAGNIETINDEFIKASNNIIIKDNTGVIIYGDNLFLDKIKKTYTISENVIIEDKESLLKINAEKIIYNEKNNLIQSYGQTIINKENEYEIKTSNIIYDKNLKKIISDDESLIKDLNGNKLQVRKLNVFFLENLLIADNAVFTDVELNIYEIEKLYYDLQEKKLAGKDLVINKDNTISINEYLPRVKSRSFSFDKKN